MNHDGSESLQMDHLDKIGALLVHNGITNNDHSMFQFRFEGDQVEVTVQEIAHSVGAQFVGQLRMP